MWHERVSDFLNYLGRHPWTWTPAAFVLGGIIGSFANVCLLRWPRGLSVNHPPSHCFNCQKHIAWYDNLPMLSYLLLRGKCRHCQAGFSSKYFWIEFFFASSFAMLWILEGGLNVNRVGLLLSYRPHPELQRELVLVFAYHALLLGTVLLANLLAFQGTPAPWSLFVPALFVGMVGGTLGAWPWPCFALKELYHDLRQLPLGTLVGLQPTPPWSPVPEALVPYSYLLGALNGGLGALAALLCILAFGLLTKLGNGTSFRGAKGDVLLATACGVFIGWPGIIAASVVGTLAWLLATPVRRRLASANRFTPVGWWVGWASLVYLLTSHWVFGLVHP